MDNKSVDITKIDLQNESLKLKNKKAEGALLSSIAEKGVCNPVLGYFDNDLFVLVDGFKRVRCCKQLHIYNLPIEEIASDEVNAFIKTLKISNSKSLHILEQAKFIRGLKSDHRMTATDIAISLEKSTAWVIARLNLLKDLTPLLEEKLFKGHFHAWNAMGILHQFKRLKIASDDEINEFVNATSNKNLSVKDIDLLANGYFKGGQELKEQIKNGNLTWSINRLKDFDKHNEGLNDDEKRIMKDLEITSKYIGRIIFKLPRLKKNNDFFATAGLLAEGILNKWDGLQTTLNDFIRENNSDIP